MTMKPRMAKLGQPKTFFSSELSNLYMSLNHFDVVKPFDFETILMLLNHLDVVTVLPADKKMPSM